MLPGVSRSAISEYLCQRLAAPAPMTLESVRLAGQGMSDDTILIEAVDGTQRRHQLAIRRYRTDGVMRELADPWRHYRTLEALAKTDIPAPHPLWFDPVGQELGGPCFGMRQMPGFVPVPWSPEGQAFLRTSGEGPLGERFVSLLADIHAVDWQALGLGGDGAADAASELSRGLVTMLGTMLNRYRNGPEPILRDALGWLAANVPEGSETVFVHGDYRTGNLLFEGDELVGVLDWEFAQPGDPMRDVAWVLAASNRVGSDLACYILPQDRFVGLYERLSGRQVDRAAVHFWQVYHQVSNAIGWMNAEHRIAAGTTSDLRMLRWSYTMPVMRRLVLNALQEAS